MTNIGDTIHGKELGRAGYRYIWVACPDCQRHHWRILYRKSSLCGSCAAKRRGVKSGILNPNWRGGINHTGGYRLVKSYVDDFFHPMADKDGYIREHRLVMAKHLGRCLQPWEVIHHKNGVKDDNRTENLELSANISEHSINHGKGYHDGFSHGYHDGRDKRIKELEAIIAALKHV